MRLSDNHLYLVISLSVFSFLYFYSHPVHGQIVINEVYPSANQVEIKNIGNTPVDVSNYAICEYPDYTAALTNAAGNQICGSTMLAPGEIRALDVAGFDLDPQDGEIGLYFDIFAGFSSPSNIVDYMEWGSSGHFRANVAINAGIWTAGDFIPSIGPNQSFEYDGLGDSSTDWIATSSPTMCAQNMNTQPCNVNGGVITTTDPTTICVDGMGDPISVSLTNAAGANSQFVITDVAGLILALPGNSGPFDLDGAGVGTCILYHLSYDTGLIGLATGNNTTTDLVGCYDLSNGITVVRQNCNDPCLDGYEGANQLTGIQSTSQHFETNQGIDSDQAIALGITVIYDASIDIDLLNGFCTPTGTTFNAYIDGCP